MIDVSTRRPLTVAAHDPFRPYIALPLAQVEEVREVLRTHGLEHRLNENVVSVDGGPEMAVIHLAFGTDVGRVQAALDSVR